MKHKHAELIKKWADGAQIQWKDKDEQWHDMDEPLWSEKHEYRIKPEEKADFAISARVNFSQSKDITKDMVVFSRVGKQNVEFLFDGETLELKGLRRIPQ